PLYPTFLGLSRYLFGSNALLAVVVAQHGLLILANLLVALICWQITGSRLVSLVGYAIAALSLMRPWFANVVCTESWFLFFLLATISALCA
uniref:hypothetical protein n=1 Tax=Salmonella sp. SAL4458 TaxID=3159913 RepID=UPI00397C45F0